MKIQTLKPRVPMLGSRLVGKRIERKRGPAGIVDRNRIRHRDKGLCQRCAADGYVIAGVQVDHIIPLEHGGPDTDENKQLLCVPCHQKKTAEDRANGAP